MAQQLQPSEKSIWSIVQAIIQLVNGRHNAFGQVTLNTGTDTMTVVSHPNCSKDSVPVLTAVNLAAAAEIGAGTVYVDNIANGSFAIHHSASALVRTFNYQCNGG